MTAATLDFFCSSKRVGRIGGVDGRCRRTDHRTDLGDTLRLSIDSIQLDLNYYTNSIIKSILNYTCFEFIKIGDFGHVSNNRTNCVLLFQLEILVC